MTVISIPNLASAMRSPEHDDEYQEVVKEEELDGHDECPLWHTGGQASAAAAVLGPTGSSSWRRVTSEMDALSDARRNASGENRGRVLFAILFQMRRGCGWQNPNQSGRQMSLWSGPASARSVMLAGTSCATCQRVRAALTY